MGHDGGQGTDSRISSLNQGSEGGIGLRDGLATVDGRFEKAHATKRVEYAQLKFELIPGSHEISN